MMLEGRFPIESQVSLFRIIANNSAKLAKAKLGALMYGIRAMVSPTGADNLRIGCSTLGFDHKRMEHRIDLSSLLVI
jgi:hypothetical protein